MLVQTLIMLDLEKILFSLIYFEFASIWKNQNLNYLGFTVQFYAQEFCLSVS